MSPKRKRPEHERVEDTKEIPSSDEDGKQYEVEVILGARRVGRSWEYLIQWYGYPLSDNSWQPSRGLDCPRMLKGFWAQFERGTRSTYNRKEPLMAPRAWRDKTIERCRLEHEGGQSQDQEEEQEKEPKPKPSSRKRAKAEKGKLPPIRLPPLKRIVENTYATENIVSKAELEIIEEINEQAMDIPSSPLFDAGFSSDDSNESPYPSSLSKPGTPEPSITPPVPKRRGRPPKSESTTSKANAKVTANSPLVVPPIPTALGSTLSTKERIAADMMGLTQVKGIAQGPAPKHTTIQSFTQQNVNLFRARSGPPPKDNNDDGPDHIPNTEPTLAQDEAAPNKTINTEVMLPAVDSRPPSPPLLRMSSPNSLSGTYVGGDPADEYANEMPHGESQNDLSDVNLMLEHEYSDSFTLGQNTLGLETEYHFSEQDVYSPVLHTGTIEGLLGFDNITFTSTVDEIVPTDSLSALPDISTTTNSVPLPATKVSEQEFPNSLSPAIQEAIQNLGYPKWLHNWMQYKSERSFLIYTGGKDLGDNARSETQALRSILALYKSAKECSATHKNIRIIFIHSGALASLHKLKLAEKKKDDLKTVFFIYGTQQSSKADTPLVGMHEVFSIGGIITLSVIALMMDPLKVFELIDSASQHPLWAAYISPFVIAYATKYIYRGQDIKDVMEKGKYVLDFIIDAIASGKLSVLRPEQMAVDSGNDIEDRLKTSWMKERDTDLNDRQELVQCYVRQFEVRYGRDIAPSNVKALLTRLEIDFSKDMACIQSQFKMMSTYRRFVILVPDQHVEKYPKPDTHVIEYLGLYDFEWKDNYFEDYDA